MRPLTPAEPVGREPLAVVLERLRAASQRAFVFYRAADSRGGGRPVAEVWGGPETIAHLRPNLDQRLAGRRLVALTNHPTPASRGEWRRLWQVAHWLRLRQTLVVAPTYTVVIGEPASWEAWREPAVAETLDEAAAAVDWERDPIDAGLSFGAEAGRRLGAAFHVAWRSPGVTAAGAGPAGARLLAAEAAPAGAPGEVPDSQGWLVGDPADELRRLGSRQAVVDRLRQRAGSRPAIVFYGAGAELRGVVPCAGGVVQMGRGELERLVGRALEIVAGLPEPPGPGVWEVAWRLGRPVTVVSEKATYRVAPPPAGWSEGHRRELIDAFVAARLPEGWRGEPPDPLLVNRAVAARIGGSFEVQTA